MNKRDCVIVGAGLWGCTLARRFAEAGLRVLVIEKRAAPGGNCRTEIDAATGTEIHTYGAHIFHTRLPNVWAFIQRFTAFNGYQHKVLVTSHGKTYFMPLGLTLINAFYGTNMTPKDVPAFIAQEAAKEHLQGAPRNLEEKAISLIGRPLYETFIRDYTRKQWNCDPRELPESIINRLPVRTSYDINYYNDPWQGIPLNGYNAIFTAMLDHPEITVRYNTDYATIRNTFSEDIPIFYSGPIDQFFDYRFGPLPWRSLRFERETCDVCDFQGTSVMNYAAADVPYTRIHEFKHFHPENTALMATPKTIICREYPATWQLGDEPFYPVTTDAARQRLSDYQTAAAAFPNVVFGGRLGEYKYYDMDQSIHRALEEADRFLAR